MDAVTYRTKRACVIGGAYRRAGETFTVEAMGKVPSFVEVVGEDAADVEQVKVKTKLIKKQTVKESAQVTPADLGIVPSALPADE